MTDLILNKNVSHDTYNHIIDKLNEEGALHFSLIDPDPFRQSPFKAARMAKYAEKAGTDAILVGGSTAFDQGYVDKTIELIRKRVDVPIIIFPGGVANVSNKADAILFMSLLNSTDPYFIVGQQALASYMIRTAGLEYISMGYLIIEPGATAGWIGNARLLPRRKPELTAAYALAADMFGFKMVYLEAGSGGDCIPPEIIQLCNKVLNIPIVCGGGVQNAADAKKFVKSGADIIVMGTFIENHILKDKGSSLAPIVEAIKEAGKKKTKNFKKL